MSINIQPYINCENADEHKQQLGRKLLMIDGTMVGMNIKIFQKPKEELSSIGCGDQKSLWQQLRECLIYDNDGNIALRLFLGI